MSEALTQSQVRLAAPTLGVRLWRNNVGVADHHGRPVRYGLANDSAAQNRAIKSADLIGWRPVLIGPEHIGQVIAQVVSVECKAPGWTFRPADERDRAQAAWAALVRQDGGLAIWATGAGDLARAIGGG